MAGIGNGGQVRTRIRALELATERLGDDEAALERARELDAEAVEQRARRHDERRAAAEGATEAAPAPGAPDDRRRP
jgi:hypothetical protein